MLRNYFLTAWRNLLRNRIYSVINLLGLALGVACCLLISRYVWHEYSYDRFHPDLEQIYIVGQESTENPGRRWNSTAPIMGEMLIKDIPEVESLVRRHRHGGLVSVGEGDQLIKQQIDNIQYVDSNFFELLGFELLRGDPQSVLRGPHQVVMTEHWAKVFFGDQDPIGRLIQVDDKLTYQVTGVAADPPATSSIGFDLLVSWASMASVYGGLDFDSWWWPSTQIVAKLHPQAKVRALNQHRLPEFIAQYREPNNPIIPYLQSLKDLHLYGLSEGEGSIRYVSLFGLVAIVILLIACVNFMNLATARSARRAREVGVRKAVGASRASLIRQFLGESMLISFLAVLLGLGLAELAMPLFNELSGLALILPWVDPIFWLMLLSLALLLGLLSGSYPALFLSRFQPVDVLKASLNLKVGGSHLRRGLVVSQFVIGLTLIICTVVIWQQHQYMLTKSLGYDRSQLLSLGIKDGKSRDQLDALISELEALPAVKRASAASWSGGSGGLIQFPVEIEGQDGSMTEVDDAKLIYTDFSWLETIGANLMAGRDFAESYGTDAEQAFLVNETMLKAIHDSSLIGRRARAYYTEFGEVLYEKKGRVVGTFQDFHAQTLHEEISPMLVGIASTRMEIGNYLFSVAVRLAPGDHQDQIEQLRRAWQKVYPNQPLEFRFAEDAIQQSYQQEAKLGRILTAFTVIAIVIALLGLLGLAAFTAQQRTKEIGVRKILGASKQHILLLLNREFTGLVLLSLLIAGPLAYWLMQEWLAEYPYRIDMNIWPYLLTGIAGLLLTWLTVSVYSLRAVWMNPADALRDE